jgi:predicted dehydrogenase
MYKGNLSRRGFLQRSLTGLAAAGVPAWYGRDLLAAEDVAAAEAKKPAGANDRIAMGAIGIGSRNSRGRDIYNQARGHKNVVYVAACDVHAKHLDRAVTVMKDFNKKERGSADVKGYKDFRQLLDDKDINAVTIATPDHWHALVAIEALRRGKDVYCEKPLTLTIEEGKAVAKVAKETGRVFQVGSQQRSEGTGPFPLACALVRNGRLGKIKRVETRIGANPESPELPKAEVPAGLDWDFWLGPTPRVDYVELPRKGQPIPYSRCEYEFRWWYDYSGGKMTDWGAHHNDIAQWGLGMDGSGPVSVEVVKAKQPAEGTNRYNCHPEFEVRYTYENGVELVCSHTQLPGAPDPKETPKGPGRGNGFRHDNGVLFVGEGGKWIFVCRSGITASDERLIKEPLGPDATGLYRSRNHMGNFLECVKSRKPTICPAEVGHRSVTVCHLGAIALRSGKKLRWDPKAEHFEDEEMNKWLGRPMRDPWKLEV